MRNAISQYISRNENPSDQNLHGIHREYIAASIDPIAIRRNSEHTGIFVISVVRDEIDIVEDFLVHYRKYGIEKFIIIDNNSLDGTLEYLSIQSDVDLYYTNDKFSTLKKQSWINIILDIYYRRGTWFIYVDADEHIVFDGMEEGRSFHDLAIAMEYAGVRRVRGCLIDMYSEQPISEPSYQRGKSLIESYPFFDKTGYKEYILPMLIAREGGPRYRLFNTSTNNFRPQLSKYPMFRLDRGDVFADPHFLWPYEKNFSSPCFLGLLHFKFLPGFSKKIDRAVREGNYWKNSFEYRCYKLALSTNFQLQFICDITESYLDSESLIRNNIISRIEWKNVA